MKFLHSVLLLFATLGIDRIDRSSMRRCGGQNLVLSTPKLPAPSTACSRAFCPTNEPSGEGICCSSSASAHASASKQRTFRTHTHTYKHFPITSSSRAIVSSCFHHLPSTLPGGGGPASRLSGLSMAEGLPVLPSRELRCMMICVHLLLPQSG